MLRTKAAPVLKKNIYTPATRRVIKRMKDALSKEEFGVAIAAPQIGESLRIFVIAGKVFAEPDTEGEKKDIPEDRIFINPVITRKSREKKELSEGCLSVRHKYGTVLRHAKASVTALNETGEEFTYHGSGLVAHIFQHECDHLDGILYVDKAVKLETDEEWQKAGKK